MGNVESSVDSSDEDYSAESRLDRSEGSSRLNCQNRLVKENQEILDLKMKAISSCDSVVQVSIPIRQGITSQEAKGMQDGGNAMRSTEEKKISEMEIKVEKINSKIVEMAADIAYLNEELSLMRGSSHTQKKRRLGS